LILVKDGEPKYSIVTAARSSVNENRAAKLLQEYIQKISGATLPIYTDQERPVKNEIIVGFSDRTKEKKWRELGGTLAPDGYQINTEKGKLLILGGKHKGTIYGVVELLEKYLGCPRAYSHCRSTGKYFPGCLRPFQP
jgi:alpha-glucuronidase